MKNSNLGVLSSLFLKRSNAIEFVVITFIIAFAISLIASSITLVSGFKPFGGIYTGLGLLIIVLFYFAVKIYRNLSISKMFTGFIVRDEDANSLIQIDRYPFSQELVGYLEDAFVENSDIKAIWQREPLHDSIVGKLDNNRSRQLLHEAVEYFVIEELSDHLSSYFNNDMYSKEYIQEIGRNEVPDILYENRFLHLFSKPREERAAFETKNESKNEKKIESIVLDGKEYRVNKHEVVYAYGVNGERFQKFDLVLPSKTVVKRIDKENIHIKTDRFTLKIRINVAAMTELPEGFWEYYLNRKLIDEYSSVFGIEIEIGVRFKVKNFFLKNKWEYFQWIDSFLERLNGRFSKESFFKKLNWNSAYTLLKILELNKQQVDPNGPSESQASHKEEKTTNNL